MCASVAVSATLIGCQLKTDTWVPQDEFHGGSLPQILCPTNRYPNQSTLYCDEWYWRNSMIPSTATEAIPLKVDTNGVVRVGRTRVTLDTVIAAFSDGATAEEIVQQYPSLNLADVYSVIAYYLRHPSEVEAYLHQRKTQADTVRKQNESRFDPRGVRNRLLARCSSRVP
jgi:uncharacterized protein (DUF433 family)